MSYVLDKPFTLDEVVERERMLGARCGPWERFWLIKNHAPSVVRRNLELARQHPGIVGMPRQGFEGMVDNDANTAAFNARNTSAAELNIIGADINGTTPQAMLNQYCAIPPNDPRAGKVYRLEATGIYSNTGTPTMIWTPRWGSSPTVATNVSLGASGTFTTITGTTNLPYHVYLTVTVRTAPPGATAGTVYASGWVKLGIPVTSSQFMTDMYIGGGTAATTVDTTGQGTAGLGLTMNLTWGTSSASNTSTCQIFFVRSLN